MKAAPFDHLRAETVDEAVAALADEDARILAGGQSLVPIMALRLATPRLLVDISRCAELSSYAVDDGALTVGAAVTDRTLERDPEVRAVHPLLARTLSLIAHPEIRARATLCGSLAHADPAAELPALLLAIDGAVEVRGSGGTRRIPAGDLFPGPFTSALAEDEMVVAAHLPLPGPQTAWAVDELARRPGDFALAGVVVLADVDEDGRCTRARVSLFGVAGTPVRSRAAEQLLEGARMDEASLDEAARAVFDAVEVLGDEVHASAAYRRRAGSALVRRALAAAARSARGEAA